MGDWLLLPPDKSTKNFQMAKPKAFLRHVNKRAVAQPISVKLSSGKATFQVAVGISIDPQFFDVKAGLVRTEHPDSLRINERIRTECKYFEKAEKQLRGNGLVFTVHHMATAYSRVKGLQEQDDEYLRNLRGISYDWGGLRKLMRISCQDSHAGVRDRLDADYGRAGCAVHRPPPSRCRETSRRARAPYRGPCTSV